MAEGVANAGIVSPNSSWRCTWRHCTRKGGNNVLGVRSYRHGVQLPTLSQMSLIGAFLFYAKKSMDFQPQSPEQLRGSLLLNRLHPGATTTCLGSLSIRPHQISFLIIHDSSNFCNYDVANCRPKSLCIVSFVHVSIATNCGNEMLAI